MALSPSVRPRAIQSVLFVCSHNAIRSPMAEAIAKHFFGQSLYTRSAGVREGEQDPFMIAVLDEIGIDAHAHKPQTIEELDDWEGLNFDLAGRQASRKGFAGLPQGGGERQAHLRKRSTMRASSPSRTAR